MLLTAFMASTTFAGIAHETDVAAFPAHAVAAKPLGQQVSHIGAGGIIGGLLGDASTVGGIRVGKPANRDGRAYIVVRTYGNGLVKAQKMIDK